MYNLGEIRKHFPILEQTVNGKPLVYFDNGATTQKPVQVIQAIQNYYLRENANIHRGVHTLSRVATELYENARSTIASFIHSESKHIALTSGTTQGINFVASAINWKQGDEIILTRLEHHSNIVPWQIAREKYGLKLKIWELSSKGAPDIQTLKTLLNENTRLISFAHVSNTLGSISPAKEIIQFIKSYNKNILVLLDAAQSAPHMELNVGELECDFLVWSGHKIYGPTGTGLLYVSPNIQNQLKIPYGGGGSIKTVTFDKTTYADFPLSFESGTPNIEGVLGLAAAVKYLQKLGMRSIANHEHNLLIRLQNQLNELPEVEIYANHLNKAAVVSFNVKKHHPFDVGTLLDKYGIAVRTGHHCTQPLMNFYGIQGTVRVSLGLYNTEDEINYFIECLKKTIKMLG